MRPKCEPKRQNVAPSDHTDFNESFVQLWRNRGKNSWTSSLLGTFQLWITEPLKRNHEVGMFRNFSKTSRKTLKAFELERLEAKLQSDQRVAMTLRKCNETKRKKNWRFVWTQHRLDSAIFKPSLSISCRSMEPSSKWTYNYSGQTCNGFFLHSFFLLRLKLCTYLSRL